MTVHDASRNDDRPGPAVEVLIVDNDPPHAEAPGEHRGRQAHRPQPGDEQPVAA